MQSLCPYLSVFLFNFRFGLNLENAVRSMLMTHNSMLTTFMLQCFLKPEIMFIADCIISRFTYLCNRIAIKKLLGISAKCMKQFQYFCILVWFVWRPLKTVYFLKTGPSCEQRKLAFYMYTDQKQSRENILVLVIRRRANYLEYILRYSFEK